MNSIWLAFITGLTTGGISCLAVQGGLLASSLVDADGDGSQSKLRQRLIPISAFLISKFISHLLLGGFLGLVGSALTLSPKIMATFQMLAGIFMLGTALRLLNVHPVFRYLAITPPRFVFRTVRKISKNQTIFAPAILGFLTVFIPCGVTQAMIVYAAASGNILLGALIMGAFVAGTSPVFLVLGAVTAELFQKKIFSYAAAAVILAMAIFSINGALTAIGSIYTLQNFYKAATYDITGIKKTDERLAPVGSDGRQEVTVTVSPRGYETDYRVLRAGVPVRLRLITNGVTSCSRAFTISELDIFKVLPETGEEVIEFTPQKTGTLSYSCSMGMYTGDFKVIE